MALQLAGDLGHKVAQVAIDHRDFQRAAEIARKTMTANPGSFNDCLWLVRILHDGGFEAEAEKELKNAVGLSKDDPNRWIALVQWYAVLTKQPEKAEQAIQEAEKNLPRAKAPRTLAQCCELMAQAYEAVHHEAAKVKWYSVAEKWYEKDRVAQPDDLPATRRLTDFFIRTKQLEKVNSLLNAVLKNASGKNSDMTVWARRTLALTLASGTDPKRLKEALSLVEPRDQPTPTGAKAKEDPEDLRILTRVLELQGTPEHRAARSSCCNRLSPKTSPPPRTGSGWLGSWILLAIGLELGRSIMSSSRERTMFGIWKPSTAGPFIFCSSQAPSFDIIGRGITRTWPRFTI